MRPTLIYDLRQHTPTDRSFFRHWPRVLLACCLIQFTGAWIYGERIADVARVASGEFSTKVGAVPFQYTLWLLIVASVVRHLSIRGLTSLQALSPFVAYGASCIAVSLFGFYPLGVVRPAIFWMIAIVSAVVLAYELRGRALAQSILFILGSLMVGSVILSLLAPTYGTHMYGSEIVWAGLFVLKNQLGWIAALALLIAATLGASASKGLRIATALAALICLVGSSSMGSIVASLAALGFTQLILFLRRSATASLSVLALAVVLFTAGVLISLTAEMMLNSLGRDVTLTGRTDVWAAYLSSMMDTPWFGKGVGAYTGASPYSLPLAFQFRNLGLIVTPHNMFLAAFGDVGLVGLMCLVLTFLYFALILPLRESGPWVPALVGCTTVSAIMGMVETRDVFTSGPTWFFLALFWTAHRLDHDEKAHPSSRGLSSPA